MYIVTFILICVICFRMTNKDGLSRRKFIVAGGAAGIAVLAGCAGSSDSNNEEEDDEVNTHLFTDDAVPEDSRFVESGEMKVPPSVEIHNIYDIDEDTVSLEMHAMPNPVDDYVLNLHYVPASEVESEWTVEPQVEGDISPEYSEEDEKWVSNSGRNILQRNYKEFLSNEISSITVPAEASGVVAENVERTEDGDLVGVKGVGDKYTYTSVSSPYDELPVGAQYEDTGFDMPYVTDFSLESDIPENEPFVLLVTVEGFVGNYEDGTVIANTPQIVKVGDEFVYPEYESGTSEITQEWDSDPETLNRVNDDVVLDENNGDKTIRSCRSSHYGIYSDKYTSLGQEFDTRQPEIELMSRQARHYMDGPVQNLWSIEYDITESEYQEAQQHANMLRDQNNDPLRAMVNDDSVIHHRVIQDVAGQLKEVCENVGADHPTEQLRVVADFVQYINYGVDVIPANVISGGVELFRHTDVYQHPVQTLYDNVGDCIDKTALTNVILKTDYFDFNPEIALFENITFFTNNPEEAQGHVSTAIPMEELEIEDVEDYNGLDYDPDSFPNYPADEMPGDSQFVPATMEHNGSEYLYVETSTMGPIGTVIGGTHTVSDYEEQLPATRR